MQWISVLGSTGSIGVSTLDVVREHPQRYRVYALAANTRVEPMVRQCLEFQPRYAVMADASAAQLLAQRLACCECDIEVLSGTKALADIGSATQVDVVMAAIVGAAGLAPTMAAVRAGKRVLLANKEALVMSGQLFMAEVEASGAQLLPVDSEHNAIFQCLPETYSSLEQAGVSRLLLTGSGGPFRQLPLADFSAVTPEQACNHPNWDMGKKISVDSATMMNKGLEFIEACWMFRAQPAQIDVVVHPQSVVHSMVEYLDGSVMAQMGRPDMRTPIAHTLAWPQRMSSGVEPLDFTQLSELSFEAPDFDRFPCLALAQQAIAEGGDLPAVLNASNEIAVEHFLQGAIAFTQIANINRQVIDSWRSSEPSSLTDVIEADAQARLLATRLLAKS